MSRPWMPLYISDYRRDTAHLSAAEHGAYLLLIMRYWEAGNLPTDERQLARIACMTPAEWRKARATVASFFGPGWTHKRIDAELARAEEISSKRRASAKQRYSKTSANAPANAPANAHTVHSSQKVDGGEDAGARGGNLISPEATALADELAAVAGHPPNPMDHPPSWHGAPMRVQAWLSQGWPRELILIGAKSAMARKRDGPPHSVNFFEKSISRAVAEAARPVPETVIQQAEVVHVRGKSEPKAGLVAAGQRRIEQLAELRRSAEHPKEGGTGLSPGNDDGRLLSQGRSG